MDEQALGVLTEDLADELRKLGVYIDAARVVPDPEGRLILVLDGLIGDQAFSDRVQDPQADSIDDQFRRMQVEGDQASFAAAREEFVRRHRPEGTDASN